MKTQIPSSSIFLRDKECQQMNKNEKVKLLRVREGDFTINFENRKYVARGKSKGMKVTPSVEVPWDCYEFLAFSSTTFRDGELVIAKDNENYDMLMEHIVNDLEQYEINSITREDIVKILNSNVTSMQKELQRITSANLKQWVLRIAKEIGIDNTIKQKFLIEWLDIKHRTVEDLFY